MTTGTNFASLKTLSNTFIKSILGGYTTIGPVADHVFAALLVIVIVLSAVLTWIWGEVDKILVDLIRKIIFFGFIFFLMQHWLGLTSDIADGFTKLGLNVGGLNTTPQAFLSNPVNTILVGWHITQQMNQAIMPLQKAWWDTLQNLPTIIVYVIALIFVMIAFTILAFQLFISYIEFLLVNLAGLMLVPFSIFPALKFVSDRSFGFVFAGGAKLFAISLIVAISSSFLSTLVVSGTADIGNAFAITIASAFCAALALTIPSLAASLISGAPQTSGTGVGMATAGVAAATIGAGYAAMRGGQMAAGVGSAGLGAARAAAGAITGGGAAEAAGAVAGGVAAAAGGLGSGLGGGGGAGGGAGGVGGGGLGGGGGGAGGSGGGGLGGAGGGAGGSGGGGLGGAGGAGGGGAGRPAWAKATGGLGALSPKDHAAAMNAFNNWKAGPGANTPYGAEEYVDYVQHAADAELP